MKKINFLTTLTSLAVVLVTIERYSFTTKVILQPYSFLRLHEVFQMGFVILFTILIPFFLLKELSSHFDGLKTRKGTVLATIFITGVYFYATGNGAHEIASYTFNQFCDVKHFTSTLCGSLFFNDFYFGNIIYFIGVILYTVPLILFERMYPNKNFTRKDFLILGINAFVFALTIFAYAAFDRVLVGLIYSVVATILFAAMLYRGKVKYTYLPFTLYTVGAYALGTVASVLVRFLH